ncbi:TetR/AcrR family transcriptional regulator [Conexibacter sp. DBS9H8]|uniref:TetR/AcrR family transcriptional regulator n=1 Tax=Conexibacter sp. DBS9H8 TaxID=2937801 RepID=UPI00200C21EC|nr:TetR/AcrR family transcriptional regulator [Conexibacter sp. DBS9H8]
MTAPTAPRQTSPLLTKLLSGTVTKTEEARDRILATAIDQISDFGVRRFTVDELARRVGLSRVTIYRHFPSREGVLEAALLRELRGFMAEIDAAVRPCDGLEQRVVEGFVFTILRLREHAVLQRLLRTEPELILPLLTTGGGPVIETGREFIAAFARGGTAAPGAMAALPEPELQVLSEILARMILSLVLTPDSVVPLASEAELRAYAQRYIGPIIRAFTGPDRDPAPAGREPAGRRLDAD